MISALVGVNTGCQHWVSTPTKGDTALEGVDTFQSVASFGRCQHLARQYLLKKGTSLKKYTTAGGGGGPAIRASDYHTEEKIWCRW